MADHVATPLADSIGADEVAFDYIKGPDYRMVYSDGAIGGRLPNGLLHFSLYGERPAIPRRQVYRVDRETGALGDRLDEKTVTRGSVVREMCCDVVMTADAAKSLANWLLATVDEIEKQSSEG